MYVCMYIYLAAVGAQINMDVILYMIFFFLIIVYKLD